MRRKYCFGPQVDLECFLKIVSCFEQSKYDRLLTEICMKNVLIALMKKASLRNNIKIVSNGLILATQLYKLNLMDEVEEEAPIEFKEEAEHILLDLINKMGW